MAALIRFFWELTLLRRTPQELPDSRWLLGLALVLHIGVGWLLEVRGLEAERAVLAAAGSTAVMVVLANLLLAAVNHPERARRTVTALAGVDVVIGLIARGGMAVFAPESGMMALWQLLLVLWSLVVTAHILRHALSTTLLWGMVIALAYAYLSLALLAPFFYGSL